MIRDLLDSVRGTLGWIAAAAAFVRGTAQAALSTGGRRRLARHYVEVPPSPWKSLASTCLALGLLVVNAYPSAHGSDASGDPVSRSGELRGALASNPRTFRGYTQTFYTYESAVPMLRLTLQVVPLGVSSEAGWFIHMTAEGGLLVPELSTLSGMITRDLGPGVLHEAGRFPGVEWSRTLRPDQTISTIENGREVAVAEATRRRPIVGLPSLYFFLAASPRVVENYAAEIADGPTERPESVTIESLGRGNFEFDGLNEPCWIYVVRDLAGRKGDHTIYCDLSSVRVLGARLDSGRLFGSVLVDVAFQERLAVEPEWTKERGPGRTWESAAARYSLGESADAMMLEEIVDWELSASVRGRAQGTVVLPGDLKREVVFSKLRRQNGELARGERPGPPGYSVRARSVGLVKSMLLTAKRAPGPYGTVVSFDESEERVHLRQSREGWRVVLPE